MRILGAILAGGQARRFGSDKARASLGGVTLIEHVERRIAAYADEVVVCGRVPGLADRPADVGPLGGLAAALFHGRERGFDAVLSAPCDTPILPAHVLRSLIEHAGCAVYVGSLPVLGVWPCRFADDLESYLEAGGNRSMRAWAASIGAAALLTDSPIANVNTVSDLAALSDR